MNAIKKPYNLFQQIVRRSHLDVDPNEISKFSMPHPRRKYNSKILTI